MDPALVEPADLARFRETSRGHIMGLNAGMMKMLFSIRTRRLLGVHIIGELATETIHVGMIAMLAEAGADLFNRACFNYPTLGDLYKYATYEAMLKRDGVVADPSR